MAQFQSYIVTILNWSFNPTSLLVSDKSVVDFKFVLSGAPSDGKCISVKIDPIKDLTGRTDTQQLIINSYKPFVSGLTTCTVVSIIVS